MVSGNTICRSSFLPEFGENTVGYWWEDRLVGLSLGEATYESFERFTSGCGACGVTYCPEGKQTEAMRKLEQEMSDYYAGKLTVFTVPITLCGTPFQKKIWTALLEVPYGTTVTYAELAEQAGVRGARATGSAVGANPIAIVVPCHRVLPKSGAVGNYSTGNGTETKQALLELEARNGHGGVAQWK